MMAYSIDLLEYADGTVVVSVSGGDGIPENGAKLAAALRKAADEVENGSHWSSQPVDSD